MSRIGPSNYHIACRKHLFREQVLRYKRGCYGRVTWAVARDLYRSTGFKTA